MLQSMMRKFLTKVKLTVPPQTSSSMTTSNASPNNMTSQAAEHANGNIPLDFFQVKNPTVFAPLSLQLDHSELTQNPLKMNDSIFSKQAPNYPDTWSSSQQPREMAMELPRFTQLDLAQQVNYILLFLLFIIFKF